MADLETLSIQISASTKKATDSINYLIQKLSKLNGILVNYSGSTQGLTNLALGITKLSDAVENANVNRIKELAGAVKTLAEKSTALSKVNASQFAGLTRGLQSLRGVRITSDQFAGVQILASSIGKLSGSNIDKAATAIPNLAHGLKQLSGIKIPYFGDSIVNLYNGLALLGRKSVVNAQGIGRIAEGLASLNNVDIDPNKIASIANLGSALAKLGYKSISQAITNIPKLAEAFTTLLTSLSKAPQVSQETLRLAEAMAQLATASKGASVGTKKTSSGIYFLRGAIQAAIPSFNRMQKRTFSLASMFGKLYASYFLVIRAFRGLGQSINIASQMTEVQNVVATTFAEMSYKLDEFADKAIYDFGMAELSARQYASRFQAMGSAMGITDRQVAEANEFLAKTLVGQKREIEGVEDNYAELGDTLADMSINLTKLAGDYASFFNADTADVADDLRSVLTGMAKPLYDYGISLREADIKEWALKNGLDANIRSMTNAEKTMLRYQYVMAQSGKVMNDYQITMNNWANVLRTIQQQFVKFQQYIGTGFINIFKPVLIRFRDSMNGFLKLVEKGLNAVGHLLGWEVELEEAGTTMNDDMEDYADALDDAAGNAKKLNSQLRSIDEINNITSNNGKGSGSGDDALGGVGGTTGGGFKFKEVPSVFESDINSWKELGLRIRDKILSGFKGISWEDLSDKVKLNAEGFVELLKGLLMPDENGDTLGGEVGKFLVEAINLGFDWLVTATGDKELWAEVGINIADFFVTAIENFDAKDAAETLNNLASGIVTMIINGIAYLNKPENKKAVTDKLGEFFSTLDFSTVAIVLGVTSIAVTSAIVKSVASWGLTQGLPTLASKLIGDKLSGSLETNPPKADISNVEVEPSKNMGITGADAIAYLAAAAIGAELGRTVVSRIVWGADASFEWGDLADSIHDYFADEDIGIHKKFSGIKDILTSSEDNSTWESGVEKLWQNYFDSLWWTPEQLDSLEEQKAFIEGYKETYRGFFEFMFEGHGLDKSKFVEEWQDAIDIIKDAEWVKTVQENVSNMGNAIYGEEGLWAKAKKKSEEVGDFWYNPESGVWAKVGKAVTNFATTAGEAIYGEDGFWANVWNKANEIGQKIYGEDGLWAQLYNNGVSFFTNLGESIYGEDGFWAKIWNKASEIWQNIKDLFAEGFDVKMPHFSWDSGDTINLPEGIKKALEALNLPTSIPKLSVEWYAQGGMPQTGSLFFAGEAGAELLGSVKGRTTVASNGEITGISDTIRSTSAEEIALLRQQNTLLQGILQKEFGITKDALFKSVRTSAQEWTKKTGNPAW